MDAALQGSAHRELTSSMTVCVCVHVCVRVHVFICVLAWYLTMIRLSFIKPPYCLILLLSISILCMCVFVLVCVHKRVSVSVWDNLCVLLGVFMSLYILSFIYIYVCACSSSAWLHTCDCVICLCLCMCMSCFKAISSLVSIFVPFICNHLRLTHFFLCLGCYSSYLI